LIPWLLCTSDSEDEIVTERVPPRLTGNEAGELWWMMVIMIMIVVMMIMVVIIDSDSDGVDYNGNDDYNREVKFRVCTGPGKPGKSWNFVF